MDVAFPIPAKREKSPKLFSPDSQGGSTAIVALRSRKYRSKNGRASRRRLQVEHLESRIAFTATRIELTSNLDWYVAPGAEVAYHAQAGGGNGQYEYRFWLRDPDQSWEQVRGWNSSDTWFWDTAGEISGDYRIQADAREIGSSVSREVGTVTQLEIAPLTPSTGVTLSTDSPPQITTGKTITFTAQGQGGSELYEYRYWMQQAGQDWLLARDYSSDPEWGWDTTGIQQGNHSVRVDVRTAGSTADQEASAEYTHLLTAQEVATGVTLASDQSRRVNPGATIEFTADGVGGSGEYEYRFWMRSASGSWSVVQGYSTDSHWQWDTTDLPSSRYFVQVDVRSQGSILSREAAQVIEHLVTDVPPVTGVNLISNAPSGPIRPGTNIQFQALAAGGAASPEYRFWLHSESTSWQLVRDYSTDSTWSWDTSAAKWETYWVQVDARSEGSSESQEASAVISSVIISPPTSLQLVSDQPRSIHPGTILSLNVQATGGAGEQEYRYWLRSKSGSWQVVRNYSTDPSWNWDTSGASNEIYYVQVDVRTAGLPGKRHGATVATFVVSPVDAATGLSITSDASGSIPPGTAVEITAQGTGGSGNFEYRFWLESVEGSWAVVQDYSTQATCAWPNADAPVGVYMVQVDVRSVGSPDEREVARTLRLDVRESQDQLWDRLIRPYLADPLWTNRDAYDAGQSLMIPLQAAFTGDHPEWRQDFADHFRNLIDSGELEELDGRLARLQYLYVASRFVGLAAASNDYDLIPAELVTLLYDEVERYWQIEPSQNYHAGVLVTFTGGIKEHLDWKLNSSYEDYGVARAITDVDLFVLGVAAELKGYERVSARVESRSAMLDEVTDTTVRVFQQEVQQTGGGGWLFQPGVFAEHSDYQFAGHDSIVNHLSPDPVTGIASDSSHAHRLPVLLTSFANAWSADSSERLMFEDLRAGLEIQFMDVVLQPPDANFAGYRTTNYMDGRNGLYRYGYSTAANSNGYGPYELSGTMTLGWWSFLGTERVREVYANLANAYPLATNLIETYVGPNTTREQHPLVALPHTFDNGFRELLARLAAELQI
ncbi:hypothetical protein [Lignipirellula cremea]|uniref:Y_Y_Y domain protein n=1 Tax=Lignipirellula cremea TaxID=2528010 RepID=A0A518E4N3_9BACT|nr:hypothetical protein [Lignipirellula cremea]QDU99039.1 Y_Y_Y domain protein [Lignipirellula cremea]